MIGKRFTWEYSHYDSTGEIHDWSRNKCLITDYLQKWELEEWCQELNKIVDENNQLQKENEQLCELLHFANTLFAFKSSEFCQKEWEKRLNEVKRE